MHSLDGKFKNDKDQIHPLNQRVKGGGRDCGRPAIYQKPVVNAQRRALMVKKEVMVVTTRIAEVTPS